MSFTITRLPNEPIIIVNFRLPLHEHLPALARLDAEAQRISAECGCAIYSIVNLGNQDFAFSDILLFLAELSTGRAGSLLDVTLYAIAVGTHPLIETGIERLHREFGVHVPLCATTEDAVAYARAQINRSASDSPPPPESDADPPPA